MKMNRTLQAVAIVAATGACFLSSKETTLSLEANARGEELAGLELFVGGDVFPGLNARKFTAAELLADTLQFVVPGHGTATVTVRLIENGRVVAEGTAEWQLSPEDDFRLLVARVPADAANTAPQGCKEKYFDVCSWWFPIVEDGANSGDDGSLDWLSVAVDRIRGTGCGLSLMCD